MPNNEAPEVNSIKSYLFFYGFFVAVIVYASYFLNDIPYSSTKLTDATFVVSNVSTPDALLEILAGSQSLAVNLPDVKTASRLNVREGWYIVPIPTDFKRDSGEKISLYVPTLSTNIEVYINNYWLGNGGRIDNSSSKNAHHPLKFNLSKSQLNQDSNKLFIRIKGGIPEWTYLGELYLGDEDLIEPVFQRQQFLKVDVIIAVTIGLFITSVLTFLFGVMRRQETYYFWYSAAEILWAIHDLKLFVKEPLFNGAMWETISILAIGWSFLGFVFFIHRYVGVYSKKIDQIVFKAGCVLSIPFVFQDIDWLTFYGYKIWLVFILMTGGYLFFFMVTTFIKMRDKNILLMMITGFIMLAFGAHDLLAVNALISPSSPYLLHFSAILIIFVITSMLLRRFIDSLKIVENYNVELQEQLSKREQQLAHEYTKIQKLQEEQAVNKERERIMRDIHDGIGGQLIATSAIVENPAVTKQEIKENIQVAIQDLRMVIDSLDGGSQDITTILGTVRMRLAGLLKQSDIELIWKVGDLPEMEKFGPQKTLHTMRIIQEAVTNVIKHSEASTITLLAYTKNCDTGEAQCSVVIEDNGCGFTEQASYGKGMNNMKARAMKIGAVLEINSELNKGAAVKLIF